MGRSAGVHNRSGVRRGGSSVSEAKPVPIDSLAAWLFNHRITEW